MQKWIGLFCLFLCFGGFPSAPAQEISYRRITMKEKLKKFYQTGGRAYLDKRVHLLVSAEVFRQEPKMIKDEK